MTDVDHSTDHDAARPSQPSVAPRPDKPLNWRDLAIWHVPLLVVAGLTALAAILAGILVWRDVLPAPWGPAVHWGLAGAAGTFVLVRCIATSRFTRREAEIFALVAASFAFGYTAIIGGAVAVIAIAAIVLEEVF